MRYELDRDARITTDLERIYDFLFDSYVAFGDHPADADRDAAERVAQIEHAMESLCERPHQGTLHPDMLTGLRSVSKDRAIFYYIIGDEACMVRVLAIFFGGQDHQRHMLIRLLEE